MNGIFKTKFVVKYKVMSVIMLYTSVSHLKGVKKKQEETRLIFDINKIQIIEIDGSQQDNLALRENLFDICKRRYEYPQFFVKVGEKYRYIGDFSTINQMNDSKRLSELTYFFSV